MSDYLDEAPIRDEAARRTLRRMLLATCAVAAVLLAATVALLAAHHFNAPAYEIQDDRELAAMKARLVEQPTDELLKERIRERDLEIRRRLAMRLRFIYLGRWLAVIFGFQAAGSYLAARWMLVFQPSPAGRPLKSGWEDRQRVFASTAVVVFMVALGGTVAWAVWPSVPPATPGGKEVPQLDIRWTRFRGPQGAGVAEMPIPLPGPEAPGEIAWRTRIPLPGKSSPVIWGNRVFVAGANKSRRAVYCYEAYTGRLLWETAIPALPGRDDSDLEVPEYTGYAACTPCVDGERVYTIFANGDLAAVRHDGSIAWTRPLGVPENQYGHAASLLRAGGHLIVPFDQQMYYPQDDPDFDPSVDDPEPRPQSKLYALDPSSGEDIWVIQRDVPDSWTTPICVKTPAGEQLITAANPWVISYDPKTGDELWRAEVLGGDVAPSPVYADGKVFVTMQGYGLAAVRVDGSGNVTESHVAWTTDDGTFPDIISPLATRRFVLTLATWGVLGAYDAETGDTLQSVELNRQYYASPSRVGPGGEKLLLITEEGLVELRELGAGFESIASGELGEKVYSSPAFGAGRVYIRGENNLICLVPSQAEREAASDTKNDE